VASTSPVLPANLAQRLAHHGARHRQKAKAIWFSEGSSRLVRVCFEHNLLKHLAVKLIGAASAFLIFSFRRCHWLLPPRPRRIILAVATPKSRSPNRLSMFTNPSTPDAQLASIESSATCPPRQHHSRRRSQRQ